MAKSDMLPTVTVAKLKLGTLINWGFKKVKSALHA